VNIIQCHNLGNGEQSPSVTAGSNQLCSSIVQHTLWQRPCMSSEHRPVNKHSNRPPITFKSWQIKKLLRATSLSVVLAMGSHVVHKHLPQCTSTPVQVHGVCKPKFIRHPHLYKVKPSPTMQIAATACHELDSFASSRNASKPRVLKISGVQILYSPSLKNNAHSTSTLSSSFDSLSSSGNTCSPS